MVAVSFIAAPFLWGIPQKNVGELFLIKRDNPGEFPTPDKILTGLKHNDNSTSPSQHWDKDLMPLQASSQLDKPAPDKNWPRSVKLAAASRNSFQNSNGRPAKFFGQNSGFR